MKHTDLELRPGKIEVGSQGLGTVTREMVIERADEIARFDGREDFNEADLAQAYEELLGVADPAAAPEASPELEEITAWDEPVSQTGEWVPKTGPASEANAAELLVREGVQEADHEQRLAAALEYPPEPE
ncbi:MAG: hypothetical protein ACR2OZ_01900 [Verrucomicrobiales bacterium]